MSDNQTFLKDKAYSFVPLLENCMQSNALSQQTFTPGTYSGKLKLKLTVQSPLHIGSGQSICNDSGQLVQLMMRNHAYAVIPGSSLKGAVRSIAEAISPSCGVKLPDERVKELEKALPDKNRKPCTRSQHLCPTCSIFGMANRNDHYRGKVMFGEFRSQDTLAAKPELLELKELPPQLAPFKDYPQPSDAFPKQHHYGNERLYYCRACQQGDCQTCKKEEYFIQKEAAGPNRGMRFRGRKFYYTDKPEIHVDNKDREEILRKTGHIYYEMLKPGSQLYGEITFQNLQKSEIALLTCALDITGWLQMKLGYGKALGCGKVKIELIETDDLLDRYRNAEPLSAKSTITVVQMLSLASAYEQGGSSDYSKASSLEVQGAIGILKQIMG